MRALIEPSATQIFELSERERRSDGRESASKRSAKLRPS